MAMSKKGASITMSFSEESHIVLYGIISAMAEMAKKLEDVDARVKAIEGDAVEEEISLLNLIGNKNRLEAENRELREEVAQLRKESEDAHPNFRNCTFSNTGNGLPESETRTPFNERDVCDLQAQNTKLAISLVNAQKTISQLEEVVGHLQRDNQELHDHLHGNPHDIED